jgi:polysaccharide pyruvyl transferase WcaK-like protein
MNISVHGAYYITNFGDILLHRILVKWIREISPDIHINLPFCPLSNLRDIGADSVGQENAVGSKALIFAGGGYFGEPSKNIDIWTERNYHRYVKVGLDAVERKIPIAIIGVGAGPISNEKFRDGVVQIFNASRYAAVRDVESRDYLIDYGVNPDRLQVTADAALTLNTSLEDPSFLARVSRQRRVLLKKRYNSLIGIHLEASRKAYPYGEVLDELSQWRKMHTDWRAFTIRDRDLRLERWVARRSMDCLPVLRRHRSMPPLVRHTSFDGLLEVIAACDRIITKKLHVGIVGCALGVNMLSIPSHPKTVRFYRQIGMANACLEGGVIDRDLETSFQQIMFDHSKMQMAVKSAWSNQNILQEFLSELR